MGKDTVQEVRSSVNEEQRGNNEQNSEAAEESAEAAGNLQALQEIKQESDSRKRGGKVMNFIKRVFSYFKFNKKYKKGEMTTGENKQRSGNGYENFLLAKLAFQSGGNSYQAQEGASLTMSAGQRKDADISSASLDRLKDDGGESVDEAAANFIDYRSALRLYAPKAVFRRKLFGSKATADYSSDKAMLNFMGDFRDLAVEGGTFHLQHEYLTDTDKFGEIASMDFRYNENTNVKTGLFFLGDGENDVSMKFKDTNVEMTGQGFTMKLGGAEAQGRTVTASTAAVALEVGVFNKKDLLFNGGITLDDSGFNAEAAAVDLGAVSNYKNLFNAESAQAVLRKDDDGSPAVGVELGKWSYGFKMALVELQKEGDSAQAEFDKQGRLHVPCPGNLEYHVKLIGKDYYLPAIGESNELLISDQSAEVSFGGQNMELFGKTLENARITAGLSTQGAHHVSLTADKAVVQEGDDGNITLKNIQADIGDKGLLVESAEMEITGSLGELTVDKAITGEVKGLSVTKEGGVEFERFKVEGEDIHNDVFSVEAAEIFAARTAATGLVLSVGFSKLNLTYSGGDSGEEESKEKSGGHEFTVVTDGLSGTLTYLNKSVGLVTDGTIKVRVHDLVNFDGKNISYVDKTLKMSEVYVGLYNCDKALSFGDYFSASALHFNGENIAISSSGLLDKEGLMRLTLKDLCILGTELGDGTVEVTNDEVKATISELPKKPISLPAEGTLTFSGGFGLSVNKAKQIRPVTEDLKASIEFPWLTLEAEGFTSDEEAPFKIDSLTASSSVLPGILDNTEMEVSGLAVTADKKLTFEDISFTYGEMYPLIEDVLSVGNPKIGFYKGFEGFLLGGAVEFTSKYFEGDGSVTVDFKKEDGFVPHISKLEDLTATIPKLATASVKSAEFETDDSGKKTIKLKEMSLSGYKQDEESESADDTTLFDRLCASAQNLKVELSEATYDCAERKFDYKKSDLTFQATKMKLDIVDGVSGTVDFTEKKLSVEAEIKLPEKNFPGDKDVKANNIPHLLELGAEIPVFPFVSVGGDIFAGAFLKGSLTGGVGLDTDDKKLDFELGAELNAAAGIGLDAYLMLGMSKMFNLKLGLRGTLLAAIPNAEIKSNIGLIYDKGLHLDKENTSVSFDTTAQLAAKLDAFVKGQLFGFINTDLLTFNIKTFNIGEAKFSGSAGFDSEGKWQFDKSFTFSSDFAKDGFDPDPKNEKSIISCTKKQVKEIDDLKNSLGNYEKVYGIQDWGSEDAMVKSAKMQKEIFPMFKDIRANNKKSFALLKKGDSQIVDKLLENEQAVAKHQRREFQSRLAEEGITGEDAKTMETIINGIAGVKGRDQKQDLELLAGDELKKHEPARVAGFLYKRFGILFDEKPFHEISDKYYDVRLKIARAKDKITSADVAREKRTGFLQEYSKFVDNKDKNIDKYFEENKDSFKQVIEKDKALADINNEINAQLPKFTDRLDLFEEYYRLRNMQEAKEKMTESEKKKLEAYRSKGSPIQKNERKIFRAYKENLDKKQKIIAEAAEARAKLSAGNNDALIIDLIRQRGEFTMHRADIDEQTNAIIESAAPKSNSLAEHDVSFLDQMMYVPSKKTTNTVFDMRELKKLYPEQLKSEADEVTGFINFRRICNRIMKLNEKETMDFYTSQFKKKITKKTKALDKDQQPNNDYYRMIYSNHAVAEAEKTRNAFKGKKEDMPTMLNALQEQNQGRIDYYESSTKLTRDTMSGLQKNILDSNDLFLRANDLFFRLNAVTPAVLTVKDEGNDMIQKPAPSGYVSSLKTLSEAGSMLKVNSEDRMKLGQLHTQSEKISTDVEKVMTINQIG